MASRMGPGRDSAREGVVPRPSGSLRGSPQPSANPSKSGCPTHHYCRRESEITSILFVLFCYQPEMESYRRSLSLLLLAVTNVISSVSLPIIVLKT